MTFLSHRLQIAEFFQLLGWWGPGQAKNKNKKVILKFRCKRLIKRSSENIFFRVNTERFWEMRNFVEKNQSENSVLNPGPPLLSTAMAVPGTFILSKTSSYHAS